MKGQLATAGPQAWRVWLRTIAGAVAANLIVRLAALAVFDIPPEFEPLGMAIPTIFWTVVGVSGGLLAAVLVDRRSEQPVETFKRVVVVALLLSLLPDLWMFTASGSAAFPGVTVAAVTTLMVQHFVAAGIVWCSVIPRGAAA